MYFNNILIKACFHLVNDLEYPVLGLSTMLANDILIINENQDSYLLIGKFLEPKEMIKNIDSIEDKLSFSSNVTLHCEINFVQCATSLNNSDIQISSIKKYNDTCLHLCDSKVRIIDNVAKIMIKNLSVI